MEWNEISYTHSFQIMDLYDDGKKMTKSESVDHISENDHTQDPCDYGLVGGYALPALHSILNQKGTENIDNFRLLASMFSLLKKDAKILIFWNLDHLL